METSDNKHWLDQLEITGPIKSIMGFVDELSHNYDRRLAALHVEYQKDVEEILSCYKSEKEEFHTQLEEQKATITALETELKSLQQSYETLNVEYKIAKESSDIMKQELSELTKTLKTEEELLHLVKKRIETANEQLKIDLTARVPPLDEFEFIAKKLDDTIITASTKLDNQVNVANKLDDETIMVTTKPKKIYFKKTRAFFQFVVANRLNRPVILRAKKEPIMTDKFDELEQESF